MSLELLEVDLGPGVRAGFTTRAGGVSGGEHAALNLSIAVGDDPEAVRRNRLAVARLLGAPLAVAEQVHGCDIAEVAEPSWEDGRGPDVAEVAGASWQDGHVAGSRTPDPLAYVARADGLVTAGHVTLAVLIADCVPVLLADPVARVVATAHAGRAGVVAGVVGQAVRAMTDRGARPERIRAALGPAICGRCYEVGDDLRAEVAGPLPVAHSVTSWGTPALDLPAAVRFQLTAAGVRTVENPTWCTLEEDRFFSHRGWGRTGDRHGRQAGLVVLEP